MKFVKKIASFMLMGALFAPFAVLAKTSEYESVSAVQTASSITLEDENTLLWTREEEKLARDVYLTLYEQWEKPVFADIADSEQEHMDAILKKIDLFGLTDPALPGIGEFSNDDLQSLYDLLVTDGTESYVGGLWVGATIEDMDIRDLMAAISATDNLVLKTTYQSLLEGSKNHLRSFVGLLQEEGVEYVPQYIDQELFDAILGF